jgi:hypothetical protein
MLFIAQLGSRIPKEVRVEIIIGMIVLIIMNVPEMLQLSRVREEFFWMAMAAILIVEL